MHKQAREFGHGGECIFINKVQVIVGNQPEQECENVDKATLRNIQHSEASEIPKHSARDVLQLIAIQHSAR